MFRGIKRGFWNGTTGTERLGIDLVGAKLIALSDKGFTVEKDGEKYDFEFEVTEGFCCDYAEVKTTLYLENEDTMPIITNVSECSDDEYEEDRLKVTLFGLYKPIAELEFAAGSQSGWGYGSNVVIKCYATGFSKTLVKW